MVKGHLGTISPMILGNVVHNFAYKFYGSYVEIPQELCGQEHSKRIVGQRHPLLFQSFSAEAEVNSLLTSN
jgi:hypothetical protein